jgi:hypothetical protein
MGRMLLELGIRYWMLDTRYWMEKIYSPFAGRLEMRLPACESPSTRGVIRKEPVPQLREG